MIKILSRLYSHANLDLGLPRLLPEWKKFFSPQYFLADATAGVTVAFVAIPLSLAIALASGVPPVVGLVTAIVAGLICAMFGGTPLAVSGPAAAMCIIVADIVEKFGLSALIVIGLLAGCMQLVSGVFGLGRFSRNVPLPIISGFTAGIGVIILIGQLPRAFGLEPPQESHIFDVFTHLSKYLHEINGTCIFLVAITIGCIRGLPKIMPKIPPILPAVAIASLITYFFSLSDVPLIGTIPRNLPTPEFPALPANISFNDLALNAFIIYLLASLETLLSSSAIDKLTNGKKHDPNQELIGQGIGNIAVSLFGGIPVTGVIVRSATNLRAGAKTRRASIIHAFIILLTVLIAAPLISLIPIAALAAVLFVVAISMINYKEFATLWITSRYEATIYGVTFLTIIFVDLLAGVQAGIIAACLIVLLRSTKTHFNISTSSQDGVTRISCVGALTFLSTGLVNDLQKRFDKNVPTDIVLFDLSDIRNLDTSGASAIIDLYQHCKATGIKFFIKGLPRRFEKVFRACNGNDLIDNQYIINEQELKQKADRAAPISARGRLLHGIQQFYSERKYNDKRLFDYISKQQNPHTLFIACSDSRVVPSMITSTDPGELFIIRNIGNFIPPYHKELPFSEAAALDFALNSFNITDIVICGHANCGAINACYKGIDNLQGPLKTWIELIKAQFAEEDTLSLEEMIRLNALNQAENLQQYPIVKQKLANNSITIHVWFYDFDKSLVYEWNREEESFKTIMAELADEPQ